MRETNKETDGSFGIIMDSVSVYQYVLRAAVELSDHTLKLDLSSVYEHATPGEEGMCCVADDSLGDDQGGLSVWSYLCSF